GLARRTIGEPRLEVQLAIPICIRHFLDQNNDLHSNSFVPTILEGHRECSHSAADIAGRLPLSPAFVYIEWPGTLRIPTRTEPTVARRDPLAVDPIAEAKRQWLAHGWTDAAPGMTLVTSIMRAQQL